MKILQISVERLVGALLELSASEQVCLLDSCNVTHLQSRFLLAGLKPLETLELAEDDPLQTLDIFERKLSTPDVFFFFTIAYDFGLKLENIKPRPKELSTFTESDIFLAVFDVLILHDYQTSQTFLIGNELRFAEIEECLMSNDFVDKAESFDGKTEITSNFTKAEYIANIEKIQELIRQGETYQTNLTQQFRAKLSQGLSPETIFRRLRSNHPAPFAAFIKRQEDFVVSISPERFFRVESQESRVEGQESKSESREFGFEKILSTLDSRLSTKIDSRLIKTSPIKGTRPRGKTSEEDKRLRKELLNSEKDQAENTMIVDLLRNDIGRVCEFGSVRVEKLCDLEEHPSLFHLVSTVSGNLREDVGIGEIIKALFPCGSITGCPKIRTMQIIDEIETVNRGLSMGAIGFGMADLGFGIFDAEKLNSLDSRLSTLDLSVAIRTLVIRDGEAIFNVGGGIVIDSDPESEYEETLVKAQAIFRAIGV